MELRDFKRQFQDFVDQTGSARRLAERDRDFIDLKHWTPQEVAVLKRRNQSPVIVPKIKKKHNFLLGLEIRGRMDPKAYPRTIQHEEDAEAITDALRYVAENSRLDKVFSNCFDEYACEGDEAVIIEVKGPKKEIVPRQIRWDRFYYDPFRRERDYSDAKYMGISVWIDRDDLARMFPKKEEQIKTMGSTPALDDSFLDRPMWFDNQTSTKRRRVRFNEHYYLEGGEWKLVFFAGDLLLTDPEPSPFLDCDGVPECPIIAESAYIDRENNSYGVVRGDISLQIEVNKRRTKALHMLSSRTVIREKGIVESGARMMEQLRSGDADIELKSEGRFEVDTNQDLSNGQLALYQDAKEELDDSVATSVTPSSGESGRSKLVDRENDTDELALLFEGHRDFKLRSYRMIWARIKQFWPEERWVRVTDDENNIKFVGLNRRVTGRDVVAERFGIQVGDVDRFLIQEGISMLPGQLDRVLGIENEVAKIDVDVIIEEVPDTITIQQEQFQVLAKLAEAYGPEEVPFEEVLKLSSLRNKEGYLERTKGNEEQRNALVQQAKEEQQIDLQIERENKQADTVQKVASAAEKKARTNQLNAETGLALSGQERIG